MHEASGRKFPIVHGKNIIIFLNFIYCVDFFLMYEEFSAKGSVFAGNPLSRLIILKVFRQKK